MSEADGSEDVNEFLLRIRELGDQRDREDEERTRKLEEEIIQGRKERQARRAERARSLSPTKDPISNAGTPHSMRSTMDASMQDLSSSPASIQLPPPSSKQRVAEETMAEETVDRLEGQGVSIASEARASSPMIQSTNSPSAAMPLSRSGTLSWQQRPSSRGAMPGRSRPLSMFASENAAKSPRASADLSNAQDQPASRSEIARSLGTKDPTFFRQNEDRSFGSAANRKNLQTEETHMSSTGAAMALPGLSRETSVEGGKQSASPSDIARGSSPSAETWSREGSVRSGTISGNRFLNSIPSIGSLRSPMPTLSSHRFEPPVSDSSSSYGTESTSTTRTMAMSPSQGRMTAERLDRPPSPTKGLGGFVQSAMLKRSDSVNKRWSVQNGPGLSRGNSMASNRSGYDGSRSAIPAMSPPPELRPNALSRETSPISGSRPGSGHSNVNPTRPPDPSSSATITTSINPTDSTDSTSLSNDNSPKPNPILRKEASSFSDLGAFPNKEEEVEQSMPMSPSKRWSPSKSSWLENAINKPDSPKPKAATPQQPSWMADLNKAKQQRGSVDLGKSGTFKEVNTGGFMRSPPPGGFNKTPSISGLANDLGARLPEQRNIPKSQGPEEPKSSEDTAINDTKALSSSKEGRSETENSSPSKPAPPNSDDSAASSNPALANSSPAKPKVNGQSSPSSKPKPKTPPKKDFTATLNSRKLPAERASENEPEFKNVFGKLKKTQTQNYVAPDELKDNILRGKAGLTLTDGPKKSERKDEFKESILQKKDSMKAGLPSASTTIRNVSKVQETGVPEAIAKRQGLTRSKSSANPVGLPEVKQDQPQTTAASQAQIGNTKAWSAGNSLTAEDPQKQSTASARSSNNFNKSLAGILSRGPPVTKSSSALDPQSIPNSSNNNPELFSTSEPSTITPQLSHMTKGRAKGPKRRLPTTVDQINTTESPSPTSSVGPRSQPRPAVLEDKQVIGRPRPNSPISKKNVPPAGDRPLANISNNNRRISQPTSPRKPSASITSPKSLSPQLPTSKSSLTEPTPFPARISPTPKQISEPSTALEKPRKSSLTVSQKFPSRPNQSPEPPPSAKRVNTESPTDIVPETGSIGNNVRSSSVKGAAAAWQQPAPVQRNGARSPIKLPTRKDEEAAHEQAGLRSSSANTTIGLGINTKPENPQPTAPYVQSLPTPPVIPPPSPDSPLVSNKKPSSSPRSPPLPGKKPSSIADRIPSNNLSTQALPQHKGSPTSDTQRTISDFFGESARSTVRFTIDTQAVITSCSSYEGPAKIKTLRKQIFEVVGDGKLLPVPSHQEHILFEENIYICTHVFGGLSGTRTTEVYLWSGDCVPISAVEDAQLFARKVAKDNNGKLVILRQGKETSNFFQALGGIVITRRGSSSGGGSPSRSTASYMLCARRHVGQIAFDEVDFSSASLCPGFPFIVTTRFDKLYLWKGSGSGADELGCARLIGMDLGLTGEIEEVDEGQEPSAFWQAFPGGKPNDTNSRYWSLKASCEKYTTRMFTVDAEPPRPKSNSSYLSWGRRGSSTPNNDDMTSYLPWGRRGSSTPANDDSNSMIAAIKEIMPFSQADMADDGIYVVDAFFEIFVVATAKSKTLLPSFRAALVFAQEYGILIASAEDRPCVPSSVVVLGRDAPKGLKRAFRKWEERRGPCITVGLDEALRATDG